MDGGGLSHRFPPPIYQTWKAKFMYVKDAEANTGKQPLSGAQSVTSEKSARPMYLIFQDVEALCGVTKKEMKGKSRKGPLVAARRHFIKLAHAEGYSLHSIGNALNKDHSTVMHHLRNKNPIPVFKKKIVKRIMKVPKDIRMINGRMVCVY